MGRDVEPAGGDADVGRAARGDREAFARLYRRFARPVFVDLMGRLGRREDAEDALQAAFLSAWTNLPRLARPGRFVPWLFRIARNKARDQLRRSRQGLACVLADDVAAPPAGERPELDALRLAQEALEPARRDDEDHAACVAARGLERVGRPARPHHGGAGARIDALPTRNSADPSTTWDVSSSRVWTCALMPAPGGTDIFTRVNALPPRLAVTRTRCRMPITVTRSPGSEAGSGAPRGAILGGAPAPALGAHVAAQIKLAQ